MCTQIDNTIIRICREIITNNDQRTWLDLTEKELLFELVSCILGSQVEYNLALLAANRLEELGLLPINTAKPNFKNHELKIAQALQKPLFHPEWSPKGRKYRFASLRANHLSRTINNIYFNGGSLQYLLKNSDSSLDARCNVMKIAVGAGPKQSSLFLRNIGFSNDLAILDSHVLRYMGIKGFINSMIDYVGSLKNYEKLENRLLEYSAFLGFSLGCVDEAIWIVMRVLPTEVYV